jgi:FMN phosphatase YigB (HAD superfamily)
MLRTFIFDLDHTTVDSSHRMGDGTLADWRRLNTAANIRKDSPLPLALQMRDAIAAGLDVVIMTSRVMTSHDRAWLDRHGLTAPLILSRDPADSRPAGAYKLAKMHDLAITRRVSMATLRKRVVMFDDDGDVQSTLKNAGFRVIDPLQYNERNQKVA